MPYGSEMVYEISRVSQDGQVDVHVSRHEP
jgi:hypothetical protein